jgi:DNA uptake protein ComE-like DNA-binding protein
MQLRPSIARRAAGSVLIVVLVVCLGLVSLVLLFGQSMLMSYRGADDELAGRQAEQAIEGGMRYAEYLMAHVTNPGDFPDPVTYNYYSEALPVGEAKFWFIGEPLESDTSNKVVFGLIDEASKLNLNKASFAMLENLPGMTDDLAQAIVTWRSPANSAASGFSAMMGTSAGTIKSAPFETVDELAQVNGGTDLVTLYGNDKNLNHVLDKWEDTGNGMLDSGLLQYVTAFSREPNTAPDGTPRVNVAIPNSPALPALLTKLLGGSRAAALMRAANQSLGGRGTVHSVLEFYMRTGMTAKELATVTPYLTMNTGQYSVGLVNVNTADQTVLSCVPGITYQVAGQIVAARSQQSAPSSALDWVAPLLGQSAAIEAGPYLTTRSYQISADIAAVGRHGRGYRRSRVVIDSSSGTPQVVYRRNLASLGWALGADARAALTSSSPAPQ